MIRHAYTGEVRVAERRDDAPSWRSRFSRVSSHIAQRLGSPVAFLVAALVIAAWAITGPIFHFSDTWQLVINTGTTIITFLMVFVIQNTQNRDAAALQIKLDEIIRCLEGAHNSLIDLEAMTDEELEDVRRRYLRLADEAHRRKGRGHPDTDTPELP